MVESKDDQSKSTMQVGNDTIFNLLLKLQASNASIESSIKSTNEKIDQFREEFNGKIDDVQNKVDRAQDDARAALETGHQLEKEDEQHTNVWAFLWIPLLISFIPTLLGHIHLQ